MFFCSSLIDLVYPPACLFCGRVSGDERDGKRTPWTGPGICPECRLGFVLPTSEQCPRCGGVRFERIYDRETGTRQCAGCENFHALFHHVLALGEYRGILRRSILKMKTERNAFLAGELARVFWEEKEKEFSQIDFDLIVPVPMFSWKQFFRGTSSSLNLARCFSRHFNRPVATTVRRTRYTMPQSYFSVKDRQSNVSGAFNFCPGRKNPDSTLEYRGKKVLLVDDILTSGATCNEVTRVLLDAGAARVTVAVLARAEGMTHS